MATTTPPRRSILVTVPQTTSSSSRRASAVPSVHTPKTPRRSLAAGMGGQAAVPAATGSRSAPPSVDTSRKHSLHRPHMHHPHRPHRQWHLTKLQANLVAAVGEFVGTFLFLFFGYAGHIMAVSEAKADVSADGATGAPTVINVSLAYSLSLLVSVWAFYRISGGLFNPSVTLGLCLSGQLPWTRAGFLVPTQLVASMCAGAVVSALFPADIGLVNTILGPGVSRAQGVFMEMFFTAYLTFVVLMLAIEKSKDTFMAPIGIGLAMLVAEIPGVFYTGGSLNPARSFGCAVASRSFPPYHWIYWVGPTLGATLAAGFYRLVKKCHYEDANPGQDAAHPDEFEQETPPDDLGEADMVDKADKADKGGLGTTEKTSGLMV